MLRKNFKSTRLVKMLPNFTCTWAKEGVKLPLVNSVVEFLSALN